MEGCCSIKWKNVLFHHLSTFYKTMAHSLRFSTGFGTYSSWYVLLLIASINLKSLDRDRCNCQAQCHQSPPVVIYSACISAVVTYSAYISENWDYADRSRLSSPIRSLARCSSVKELARNERRKKRNVLFPTCFSLFVKLPRIFPRFAPSGATISCPWHGRTFNFNHRPGNYKSCSRSRTLSIKDFRFSRDDRSGWQEREGEGRKTRERNRGRVVEESSFRLYLLSILCSFFIYSLRKANRRNNVRGFFPIIFTNLRGSSGTICEIDS